LCLTSRYVYFKNNEVYKYCTLEYGSQENWFIYLHFFYSCKSVDQIVDRLG